MTARTLRWLLAVAIVLASALYLALETLATYAGPALLVDKAGVTSDAYVAAIASTKATVVQAFGKAVA